MGPFEMVIAIVACTTLAGVINNWVKVKHRQTSQKDVDLQVERLQGEIVALTERVHVLERIATDKETRLKAEISELV